MRKIHNVCLLMTLLFFSFTLYAGKPDEFYKKAKKSLKSSPQEALKNYSEALRYSDASWKKRAECLNDRGKLLFEMHRYSQALSDLREAITLNAEMFNAWKYSIKILYEMGRFSEALNQSEQALELNDKDAEIYFLRGVIFFKLFGVTGEAIRTNMLNSSSQALTTAISRKRKYQEAYFYRGLVNMIIDDLEAAQKDLLKAIKYNKHYPQAYYELAKIHLKKKENIVAIELLEKCLEENADYGEGLDLLLSLCAESDFKDKIQKYLTQALKYYPSNKRFRSMNRFYKIVPEVDLPELKEKVPPLKLNNKGKPVAKKPSVMHLTQEEGSEKNKESQEKSVSAEEQIPIKEGMQIEFKKDSTRSAGDSAEESLTASGAESNWY